MKFPAALLFVLAVLAPLASAHAGLASQLARLAPKLERNVLQLALDARQCALQRGLARQADRLAVIDYALPSTQRRLWVFDIGARELLFTEYVAHGQGSGDNWATAFSNREGSHQTSLGLFATAETYIGGNGYSLRLDGLEPGINDRARDRAIVIHGADYVNPLLARQQGRLGRSYGCPAVRPAVARRLIDSLREGQLVFAYYPDQQWQRRSRLLDCSSSAGSVAAASGGGGHALASP